MPRNPDAAIVAETLSSLTVSGWTVRRGLAVAGLITGEVGEDPTYLTLEQALAHKGVVIEEVGRAGEVNRIAVTNRLDRPVLLIDGEELLGAKQNRIVNLSILLEPRETTVIPVSCVERGRWAFRGVVDHFESASRTIFARARAAKSVAVTEHLFAAAMPEADQGAVWSEVGAKACRMGVTSPSEAMADLYGRYEEAVEELAGAFGVADGQVGIVVGLGGKLKGIELFDHPRTLEAQLRKILRGYALDALELPRERREIAPESREAQALLERLATAKVHRYEPVGLGTHLRFEVSGATGGVTGGALAYEGRVVHLCAFTVRG